MRRLFLLYLHSNRDLLQVVDFAIPLKHSQVGPALDIKKLRNSSDSERLSEVPLVMVKPAAG